MNGGLIDFDPSSLLQLDRLARKFGELAARLVDVGSEAAGKYVLMILKKEIPAYKYVSRAAAYGRTFFSEKQRRWFWAAVKSGEIAFPIHYVRTGALENGWKMTGSGTNLTIYNTTPGAFYAYSEAQARQLAMVGWRKLSSTLEEKERNATDSAARAIANEISKTMNSG